MKVAQRTLLATAIACVLTACSADDQGKASADAGGVGAKEAAATPDPMIVAVDAEIAKRCKTAPMATVEFREVLRIPASARADETRVARIGASVTGRITALNAIVGQEVVKGQTLAVLNSTELSLAQSSFLKAYAGRLLAQREADRAQLLFEGDVIGQAELQRRQTELSQAEADLSAAHDQLKVLGMSERSIARLEQSRTVDSQSFVVAPVSGIVIERAVTQGQVVQPADAVFTVADLARLWVEAEVPEKQADLVKVGDVVRVAFPALDGRTVDGRLSFVSATVNPESRTVTARTEVANADHSIRPAMLAVMLIRDRPTSRPAIPADAVVREDNKDFVFMKIGDSVFRRVSVRLGADAQGLRPVLEGIKVGDVIVTEGASHLDNERKKNFQ